MSINLRLGLVIVAIFLLIFIITVLRKKKMPVKYSLVWILSSLIILLIALIPSVFIKISTLLGFETMSNMIIGVFIFILLIITLVLTIIVSGQRKKITTLIQEVSLLKEKQKRKRSTKLTFYYTLHFLPPIALLIAEPTVLPNSRAVLIAFTTELTTEVFIAPPFTFTNSSVFINNF